MKKTILTLIVAVMAMACAMPAQAKIKFGARAGILLNNLDYDLNGDGLKKAFDDKLAWQLGVMVEVPLVLGLNIDAAAMYTHHEMGGIYDTENHVYRTHALSIPLYLKYKLNIVGVGKYVKPMVFLGPELNFLINSDKKFKFNNMTGNFESFNSAINFGFGVELISHLQITAAYSLGLNKSLKYNWNQLSDGTKPSELVKGTDRHWTISAAVLF